MNTRKLVGTGIAAAALIGVGLTTGAATATAAPAGTAAKASATSTAAAAPHYWRFKSKQTGTCLSDSSSHVASVRPCSGSAYQKWDWIPGVNAFEMLQNKATHRCLRSVLNATDNRVTTVACNKRTDGVLWGWDGRYGSVEGVSDKTGSRMHLVTKRKGSAAVYGHDENSSAGPIRWRWTHLN